jgi:integrase
VWPAAKASLGHIVPNSIYEPHRHAIKESGVRPFVLYSLRHPFLTRLGATGVDAWTLARIAGHGSVAVSSHCVHPQDVYSAVDGLVAGGATGYRPRKLKTRKLLNPAKA